MSTVGAESVKQIYPTSTVNPQYYIHGKASHTIKGGNLTANRFGGGQQRANVVAKGSEGCDGLEDHGRAVSQGYMCSPKDWRNVEMTLGIGSNWTGSDGITQYCRGGTHTGGHGCSGFAYKCTLTRAGKIRMAKESWHVQYDYWDDSTWQGGANTGFKFICHDNGQFVTLECWLDPGHQNNWKMAKREVDNGYGRGGSSCGHSDGGPGLWGGPFATLRSDEDDIDVNYFSVREINPAAQAQGSEVPPSPTNPGTTTPGDSANGGGYPANTGGAFLTMTWAPDTLQ